MGSSIAFRIQIFHQVFWTIISFLIFYRSFVFCFKNPVLSALKLRLVEQNLLRDLIEKENNDKKYFEEKKFFLKNSKKEKIDSYVIDAVSKDEKNWHESLVQIRLETKNLIANSSCVQQVPEELIESIYSSVIERFSNDIG